MIHRPHGLSNESPPYFYSGKEDSPLCWGRAVFKRFTGRLSDDSLKYNLRHVSGSRTITLVVRSKLTSIWYCDIKAHSFVFC